MVRGLLLLVALLLLVIPSRPEELFWIGAGISVGFLVERLVDGILNRYQARLSSFRVCNGIGAAVLVTGAVFQSGQIALGAIGGLVLCQVWLWTDPRYKRKRGSAS